MTNNNPRDATDNELLIRHLSDINQRWVESMDASGYDSCVILAGDESLHFQDDQGPPFVANPYLVQWIGSAYALPQSALIVEPGRQPTLLLHRSEDYWHAPGRIPLHLQSQIDLQVYNSSEDLLVALDQRTQNQQTAVVGPSASGSNQPLGDANPIGLINLLAYQRATKTDYELDQMRAASRIGARGHNAARDSFYAGASEFETHLSYLGASRQNEHATPYPNIIAQNEHASLLHYQHHDVRVPDPLRTLLIDAGGNEGGYASDITRTYVTPGDDSVFGDLLGAMLDHQDNLIDAITPGISYLKLHEQMHRQLAEVLTKHGILNCDAQHAFDAHWTEAFCPHGLGHLLGLQVHDVGGQQTTADGQLNPPPSNYPTLRFTRDLEINHVFTIEPGLYFIASLLDGLRERKAPVNWQLVERLLPYGGIRIEDNVRVLADGCENLTRDAFAAVG